MALQHLTSSTANKRPTPAVMSNAQLAINSNTSSPGLFFKDSAGALIKVGPVHVGSAAPNASPASGGGTGNTVGEQWLDTTGGTYVFKVWDGSAWRSETGTFVDVNGDVMTGALGIIAGSAGSPGLYFSGDTNTGLYSPGADQVAISTNGTGRLFVDASGNIGIGSQFTLLQKSGVLPSTDQIRIRLQHLGGTRRDAAIRVTYSGGWTSSTTANRKGFFDVIAAWGLSSTNTFTYLRVNDIATRHTFTESGFEVIPVGSNNQVDVIIRNPSADQHSYSVKIELLSSIDQLSVIESVQEAKTSYVAMNTDHDLVARGTGSIRAITNDGERLRITSAGLVGVGTSSPSSIFHAATGTGVSSNITLSNPINNWSIRTGTTANSLEIIDNQFGVSRLFMGSGGLGVGTTSPASTLHVNSGSTGTAAKFESTGSGSYINFVNSSGSSVYAGASTTAFFVETNGSERFRCDSSGRLLVGTTDGSGGVSKLVVQGASNGSAVGVAQISYNGLASAGLSAGTDIGYLRFTDQGSNSGVFAQITATADATTGSSDYPGRLVFSTTADGASSPTERMRIHSGGAITTRGGLNIGDSTMASGGAAFILNGSIIGSGAGTYPLKWNNTTGTVTYDTSSRLIKEQIVNCPYGIETVKQLQPRKYFRTDDQREEIGFVADEVVGLMPEFVPVGPKSIITRNHEDTEEIPLGVNYDKLTAVLTKALQEAINEIESLKARVAALEAA
jgi:hypothetical protein